MKKTLEIKNDNIITDLVARLVSEDQSITISEDPIYDVIVDGQPLSDNHSKIVIAAYLSELSFNPSAQAWSYIDDLELTREKDPALTYILRHPDLLEYFQNELKNNRDDMYFKYGSYFGALILPCEELLLKHSTSDSFSVSALEEEM